MSIFRQGYQRGHQPWVERWRELWRDVGGELWEKCTKTKYTHTLEAEVARLRAENRAMLNSILGIAGVPPIPAQESDLAAVCEAADASRDTASNRQSSLQAKPGIGPRSTGVQVATPLRRRSWHQINRMLEFQATHPESPAPVNGSHGNSKP